MPRVCVCYFSLLFVDILVSVSSLHVSVSVWEQIARPQNVFPPASYRVEKRPGVMTKRPSRPFGSFFRLMQKHSRHLDEQAFVDRMFRLFDMNADNLIERDEFRAIMQLLGLISYSYHK